jgi:ABC-2 type transport system ATP-binding protein
MAAVIKTVNLTKRYGTLVALSNLNLEINEGDCFGFIGPNGAGKTTTIKILATLLQPTWGEARVCDFVVGYQSRQIRPLIGYVPDYFGAYEDMVVQEYLEFFAAAYNINGSPARTKIVNDVLELTDLGYKRDALVDGLSRGMKQRSPSPACWFTIPNCCCSTSRPAISIPAPASKCASCSRNCADGQDHLISSTSSPSWQDLCNTVGIIERGELIYSGPWTDIVKRASGGLRCTSPSPPTRPPPPPCSARKSTSTTSPTATAISRCCSKTA